MAAALHGNTIIGTLLIESGAELDRRNKFQDTALSLAAHTGHPSFVSLLLRSGASLECHPFGNSLDSFLDWASEYGWCSDKIRKLFENERKIREDRNHDLDRLV